jgi:hypothetical protein
MIFGVELDDAARNMVGTPFEDTLNHRLLCGDGSFDLPGFVAVLRDLGFDGPWVLRFCRRPTARFQWRRHSSWRRRQRWHSCNTRGPRACAKCPRISACRGTDTHARGGRGEVPPARGGSGLDRRVWGLRFTSDRERLGQDPHTRRRLFQRM